MRVRFTATGSFYSFTYGRVRFRDGEEADLENDEARELLEKFPQCFKLVRPDENKMMAVTRDK